MAEIMKKDSNKLKVYVVYRYASVTGLWRFRHIEMFSTIFVTSQDFTWPMRFVTPPDSLRAGP